MARPFVTIGVPTYNRHDLLRDTLNSILSQSFTDFEVIVGNDFTAEVLTGDMLGISDPRIRFVNHPRNLREVGNMNALLALASGRYFTWLFDDDLYEPDFLATACALLTKSNFPPAFFSSCRVLRYDKLLPGLQNISFLSSAKDTRTGAVQGQEMFHTMDLLTGREFLGRFIGSLKIVSTSGLFDTAALRGIVGGVEELCDSAIGLYCEYLFLIRCGQFDRIAYTDVPFVLMRAHTGSWSESNLELDKYHEAGKELVRRCGEVLKHPGLLADYDSNLAKICKLHLVTYAYKSARLEIARKAFGPAAACRALSRLVKETAKTKSSFASAGGSDNFRTTLMFALAQIRQACLICGTLAVHWLRQFRPKRPELG
ncbi:glycosyltransferase family 2 protein [Geobacter sp. FeAm09]|uniref:glycosyltransferase family 2 protein n=1 Tax=Geobacter sp. FeAm09 TaxID=2597769 RepID=UPI0011ECC5CD|nr:glycosyltransferase family 2 protein [Geobacter sp. FeAm09]QEM66791.1 glycosyltransferase family 2 protein [Geobacter sp. FeAm09]